MTPAIESYQEEKKEVLNAYRNLMRACLNFTSKAERKEIRRAFEYSLEAHEGARRKSGEAYIFHPIAVAKIVIKEIGLDATSVVCALLHDVVEDTFAEIDDIEREFGTEVANIIDGLTKISGVFDHKSSAQAENFRKMLLTLSDDTRVILIKLADRLHNMRTLQFMKKEGQLKIASETLYLYAPLAGRLGLYNIKNELEDLALKYTDSAAYLRINAALKKVQRESRYYIQSFIKSIRDQLKATGLDFKIKSRFKSVHSIYSKMQRQGINFDEVYDLFAIRIILDSPHEEESRDCWTVYSIITEMYTPNPERLRDWITLPKSNGYESLHVTVMGPRGKWIEVQIRSDRMDYIAEHGMAAHWRYKEDGQQVDEYFEKWLDRVRDILENTNLNAIDVVREFQTNLVPDEVFVFTPRGDLIQLPSGSTVLDFAYEIHSNIGHACIGAKVNNKVVPLKTTLQNGDQVEIITSKKQKPKQEWLQYVMTSKARHKIKESIRKERRIVAENGKELFQWSLGKFGISEHDMIVNELMAFFRIPTKQDLFYRIGARELDMLKLQEFIRMKRKGEQIDIPQPDTKQRKVLQDRKEFEAWLKKNKGMSLDMLMVGGDMDLSEYHMAECCQPIPGDDILGFYTPEDGIVIHRTNCKKAISLMSNFGGNIIKSKWTDDLAGVTFLAGIKITGEDRQGIVNDLVKVISNQMKLNMRSITIDSLDGMFEGTFKVFIHDAEQLDQLFNNLRKVRSVLQVARVEEVGRGY